MLLLFVITPLVSTEALRSELGTAFFSLLAITGVAAVRRKAAIVGAVAAGAVASVALDWIAHFSPSPAVELADVALRAGFVLLLALVVTAQVFRPGNISHHRVQGAIVVYLLAGLAWGYGYEILAMLNAASFNIHTHGASAFARAGLFRYFSFETLTTLGYGDVLPVTPMARSMAACEALFGQLYPAVLIARLVGMQLGERGRRRDDAAR